MTEFSTKIVKVQAQKEILIDSIKGKEKYIEELQAMMIAIEELQAIIQVTAKETQEQIKIHIEDVVNAAISTCFPDEYTFTMEFEIRNEKTEALLAFSKGGFSIDPMSATGGGLVDIASFALRVAAWSLGNTHNVLVLDEPLKFLSRDLQNRAGEIIQEISRELGIQMIMVTHIPDIIGQADKVIEIQKVK